MSKELGEKIEPSKAVPDEEEVYRRKSNSLLGRPHKGPGGAFDVFKNKSEAEGSELEKLPQTSEPTESLITPPTELPENQIKNTIKKETQETVVVAQKNEPRIPESEATLAPAETRKSKLKSEGQEKQSGMVVTGPEAEQLMEEQYKSLTGEDLRKDARRRVEASAKNLYGSRKKYIEAKKDEVRQEAEMEEFFRVAKDRWDAMTDEEKGPYFKNAREGGGGAFMQVLDKEWKGLQARGIHISKEAYYGLIQEGYRSEEAKIVSFLGFFKKVKVPNFSKDKKGLKMTLKSFESYINELHGSFTEKIEETARLKLNKRINEAIERHKRNIERNKKTILENAIRQQEIETNKIKNADNFGGLFAVLNQRKAIEHKYDIDRMIGIVNNLRKTVKESVARKNKKELEDYLSAKTGAILRLLDGIEGLRDKVRELLIKENNLKITSGEQARSKPRKIRFAGRNIESLEAAYSKEGEFKFKAKSRKK